MRPPASLLQRALAASATKGQKRRRAVADDELDLCLAYVVGQITLWQVAQATGAADISSVGLSRVLSRLRTVLMHGCRSGRLVVERVR